MNDSEDEFIEVVLSKKDKQDPDFEEITAEETLTAKEVEAICKAADQEERKWENMASAT